MKKTSMFLFAPVLALAIVAPIISRPAKAAADRTPTHDVVVMQSEGLGISINDSNGPAYQYAGLFIYNSSSSAAAPQFPQETIPAREVLTNTAEGIALLLDQGFVREANLNDGSMVFVRRR